MAYVRRVYSLIADLRRWEQVYASQAAETPEGPERNRKLERQEFLNQMVYEVQQVASAFWYWR